MNLLPPKSFAQYRRLVARILRAVDKKKYARDIKLMLYMDYEGDELCHTHNQWEEFAKDELYENDIEEAWYYHKPYLLDAVLNFAHITDHPTAEKAHKIIENSNSYP